MSLQLAPAPVFQGIGFGGLPLPGGKLFTYVAGTSTPQGTYTDGSGNTLNTNPVILNSNGQADVWLVVGQTYKLVLQDQFGNQVWSKDNIPGGITATIILTKQGVGSVLWPQTPPELSVAVTPTNFVPSLVYDPYRYGAVGDGITDDTVAMQKWINVLQASGNTGLLPATPGAGFLISAPLAITSPVTIFGEGIYKSCIFCNGCDGFTIAAGTAQVTMADFRINQVVRYQQPNGTITVNSKAGVRMLGTAVSACSNHYYRNIFCDGFQTGFVANGAAFTLFDNCSALYGLNGIIAATFPVNVQVRGGAYQCGNLSNAGSLTGSVGVQFGDGATATQGCTITDGAVITGFAINVWLFGANFCKVADSFLDFSNGTGLLCQSSTNASTNHDITNNYVALTSIGNNGIRLLNNTASSNPLGSRVRGNTVLQYAAGSSYGMLCDGTSEQHNIITNNVIKAGSAADISITQGAGHIIVNNQLLGVGIASTVQITYANNTGAIVALPALSYGNPIAGALITSTVTMNNGAASGAGTITNAPAAGNPTKWIPVNDNGTTRYFPAW